MTTAGASLRQVDDHTDDDLLAEAPLVLLHFTAEWCGPCNGAMEPVLRDLAETYDDLVVAVIDAETDRAAIDAFEVDSLLATVLLEEGIEVRRFRGKTPYRTFERAIEAYR